MKKTNTNVKANEVNKNQVEFLVWVREKATRECKVITIKAEKASEVASIVRATGEYSFKACGRTEEELKKAMDRWEETNAKSIAYHKAHDNKEAFEASQKAVELIKSKLTKKEFEQVCDTLKLSKYVVS